jgi:hypothetical protein
MTKNSRIKQSLATSRVDQLVHAIALAMLRRQMQSAWPRR